MNPLSFHSPARFAALNTPQLGLLTGVALLSIVTSLQSAPVSSRPGSVPYAASVTGAGNSHAPVFSTDGTHIAFVSQANNLVTNDDLGPHLDLFVRDLVATNTVLVSVSTNGWGGANDNIGPYMLSSNAHIIAFETDANNLAPNDTNHWSDIYVRDLTRGVTRLVTPGANGPSSAPLLSEDGQRVIFESLASNLVTNDFNGTNDIFIHDLTTGITELVSVNDNGTASADGPSHSPSISADGLFVAFASRATNLVIGVTNLLDEIYVRDIAGSSNFWAQAAHLSGTHSRSPVSGALEPYRASEPVLSANGRFVAFKTLGQTVRFDLHRPTNSVILVFTNNTSPTPYIAAHRFDDNPRLGAFTAGAPLVFSADGRYLASGAKSNLTIHSGIILVDFESLETNWFFLPPSGGGPADPGYFTTNVTAQARAVVTNFNFSPPGWLPVTSITTPLAMSRDGRRLFFLANPTNSVVSPGGMSLQIYSLEFPDGAPRLFSTNQTGLIGPSLSGTAAALSADGIYIAWDSPDDDIVAEDLNRAWDVFVRHLETGETTLVSARHRDLPDATSRSSSRLELNPHSLNADGGKLAFLSFDGNHVPNDTNRLRDVFVRDLKDGTTVNASRFPRGSNYVSDYVDIGSWPSLSANGRFLVFSGDRPAGTALNGRKLFWRDLQAPTNRLVFSLQWASAPVVDNSGRLVAFHTAQTMDTNYPDVNGTFDVFVGLITPHPNPACVLPASQLSPLFISTANGTNITANGPSQNPVFSPDSQWAVFQSLASNLLSNALPAQTSYQLYARHISIETVALPGCEAGAERLAFSPTRLISLSASTTTKQGGSFYETPLPGGATNPVFSADSRFVFFQGSTSNTLYRHDLMDQPDGLMGPPPNLVFCSDCINPSPSADGRLLAFESPANTNSIRQIYVRDPKLGSNELVSVSLSGTTGNGSSFTPLISYDARFVVFASKGSDLVPGDNNRATDIFVRDRYNRVTHCLSRNFTGTGTGNRVSSNPIMSADGRTVAFQSFASDLVTGDYNDTRDVFVISLGGPDADGDGMDDDWEMAYFSTLNRDGSGDFDGDGASDLTEFRAGTNPSKDASVLRVITLTTFANQPNESQRMTTIIWAAIPGRSYRVQVKEVVDEDWIDLPGDVLAVGVSASKVHAAHDGIGQRFYRVVVVP